MESPEERFVQLRSSITQRSIGGIAVAEMLSGVSNQSISSHWQSNVGDLGGGPYTEAQFISNWTYRTAKGNVTLELAVSPSLPEWSAVVTITTTDGFSEVLVGHDNDVQIRKLLVEQFKRINGVS